ncbi:TetR/AcrR family transcriptional regulator [Streptomyces sp. NPDC056390]|uniref:TetR/AcrR family transcriptional regulator n=1 Tax=Streptomyces sp. NPDC056390 TaxID=3345806 RepID=UPI0035DC0DBC
MGRRSLAGERKQQIIEATTRCLRRHGLAGATLERIAEESGMSRSHIRHYIGNREDLLLAVVRHLHERYDQAFAASVDEAAQEAKLAAVMDYLYGPEFTAPGDDNAVIRELLSAGLDSDAVREAMLAGYQYTLEAVEAGIAAEHPDASAARRRAAAYGLLCLALGNAVMADMDLRMASGGLVRVAAEAVVEQLARPVSV